MDILRKGTVAASKHFLISIPVLKTKSCYVLVNVLTNIPVCINVPVLYCIVLLYLMSMIKIINSTNKDQLMPRLRQNMERQKILKVLPH